MVGIRGLAVLALAMATAAHADVFTVGSGAACTHATIQDAIAAGLLNGNGLDVINVARNRTYTAQALVAQNDTLVIQGGFADCNSAATDPANPTVLSGAGGGAAPVLRIQGNGNVTLRNLILDSGDTASNADGGALAVLDGPHLINLDGVRLQNSRAGRGAGLSVSPSGANAVTVTFFNDSRVSGNQASGDGGGIYCRNSTLVAVTDSMLISSNSSGNDGGGIYADHCKVDLASGNAAGVLFNNLAPRYGGGLYAVGAGSVTKIYSIYTDRLTRVIGNHADTGGGAIYALDGADLQIQNVEFLSNNAQDGGAILMRSAMAGTTTTLDVGATGLIPGAVACPAGRICNRYYDNRSVLGGAGSDGTAAIAFRLEGATTQGRAQIHHAIFDSNHGGRIVQSLISNDATGRYLELSNVALVGNEQSSVLGALLYGNKLSLSFVSIGGNSLMAPMVIRGQTYATVLSYVAAWQPGKPLLTQAGGSVSSAYLIANDLSGIPATTNNLTADPRFVSGTDLHLLADSPALDYATSSAALPAPYNLDLEGRSRPSDDGAIANEFGPIDVGAYEQAAETLFRHGFEN